MKGLWNSGLEKPLSSGILTNYYGNVEDNVESNEDEDDGGLACEVQKEIRVSPKDSTTVFQYVEPGIYGN